MAQTVENSASYLLPYIKPDMKILDVGCGSVTLTCAFAKYVPNGLVIGIDKNEDGPVKAREQAASKAVTNIAFSTEDALSIAYPDSEFDIVHSHQMLHHVNAPAALKEMMRVTKEGGSLATRDASEALCWPSMKELLEFKKLSKKNSQKH